MSHDDAGEQRGHRGSMSGRSLATVVAVGAFVLSLALLPTRGTIDVDRFWLPWIESIGAHGIVSAYARSGSDYPPLAFVALSAVSISSTLWSIASHTLLKLSLWLSLVASSAIFFGMSRNVALTTWFFLSLVLNSVALAYLDIYFVPWLLLALWALRDERFGLALLLFAVSASVKFQPLLALPALAVFLYRRRVLRVSTLLPTICFVLGLLLLFGAEVFAALLRAGDHRFLSGQALNFPWLVGYAVNVLLLQRSIGEVPLVSAPAALMLAFRLLFLGLYGRLLIRIPIGTFRSFLSIAAVGCMIYFAVSSGVHENHLVMPLVLFAVLAAETGNIRPFVVVTMLANANLFLFYGFSGTPMSAPVLVVLDVLVALAIVMQAWSLTNATWVTAGDSAGEPRPAATPA